MAAHLAVETALLAGGSAALGLWLSWAGMPAAGGAIQRHLDLPLPGGASALDPGATVVLIAIPVAGLLAGLLGILPVAMTSRRDLARLRPRPVSGPSGAGGRSLRAGLIVLQVGISLALAINGGLMITSAYRLRRIEPGFVAEGLGVGRLSLPERPYPGDARRLAFFDELLALLRAEPGVEQAAVVSHAPFRSARANTMPFRAVGASGTAVV